MLLLPEKYPYLVGYGAAYDIEVLPTKLDKFKRLRFAHLGTIRNVLASIHIANAWEDPRMLLFENWIIRDISAAVEYTNI